MKASHHYNLEVSLFLTNIGGLPPNRHEVFATVYDSLIFNLMHCSLAFK